MSGRRPAVDGPSDRGWQRHEDDLVALADHAQHPMAVFLAEVSDVRAGGFEDLRWPFRVARRRKPSLRSRLIT
jgi:hypothetical protein